jgi:hypothetical protein
MAAGPGIRIGDAEREAAATSLREHYAAGRLTMEEFQERLDATFAAKTNLDLAKITADLPYSSTYTAPWPPQQPIDAVGPTSPGSRFGPSGPFGPFGPSGSLGPGPGYGRTGQSFAWVSRSLILLALFLIIAITFPISGVPKVLLILLAVFAFLRRMIRRIGSGGSRRRW